MYGIAWVWWYFGQQLWFVCLMRAWCVAGEDLKEVVSGQWVAWKQLGDNAAAPPFTHPPCTPMLTHSLSCTALGTVLVVQWVVPIGQLVVVQITV